VLRVLELNHPCRGEMCPGDQRAAVVVCVWVRMSAGCRLGPSARLLAQVFCVGEKWLWLSEQMLKQRYLAVVKCNMSGVVSLIAAGVL